MSKKNKLLLSGCPVAFGLNIFGDRWSLLIIREMMLNGKSTNSQFQSIEEGIATNILADRLRHLEEEGIVTKERDPDNRRSFIYTLTQKGRELAPVVAEIILWSGENDERPFAKRQTFLKVKKDREAFIEEIKSA